jgi:hypothetical protein
MQIYDARNYKSGAWVSRKSEETKGWE